MKKRWITCLLVGFVGVASAQEKPNVLVILADDLGYSDPPDIGQTFWLGYGSFSFS